MTDKGEIPAADSLPQLAVRYVAALLGDESARECLAAAEERPEVDMPAALRGDISYSQAWTQMRDRIFAIGDESYGLAPQPLHPGHFDLHIGIMCHGKDVQGALRRFVNVSHLIRPDFDVHVHKRRNMLEVSLCLHGPASPVRDIYHEVYAVVLHCALRWMTGEAIHAAHVRAAPPPPGIENTFVTVLSCPIRREGTGVTLYYPLAAGDLPILPVKLGRLGAVPIGQFMRELRSLHVPEQSAGGRSETRRRVETILARESLGAEAVARRLGLSVATLRRRLGDEGVSFREITTEMRKTLVTTLIESGQPFSDIASELGFSDERSFRRACTDWFGMNPARYRQTILSRQGQSGPG